MQIRHNLVVLEKPFFRRGCCVLRAAHHFRPTSDWTESDHDLISLFEHDLFGKPVPTFPDHSLEFLCGTGAAALSGIAAAKLSGNATELDETGLPGFTGSPDEVFPAALPASSSIFSTRTRISAPRLVRIGGGPGLISGGFGAPLAATDGVVAGGGNFVSRPMPGISFTSTPWWAATMMSCHVCAGREPPVMRLVGE